MSGVDEWESDDIAPWQYFELTTTAPGMDRLGSGDAMVAFNRSEAGIWNQLWASFKRADPSADIARVLELQRRGAKHSHGMVRTRDPLSLRRVRRMAESAGYGPKLSFDPVRSIGAYAGYQVGYLMKGRDDFPAGTHVLQTSHRWSITRPASPAAGGSSGTGGGGTDDEEHEWLAGPPVGMPWWDWADSSTRIAGEVERAFHRRRRHDESQAAFDLETRQRFALWLRSPAGVKARLRKPSADGRRR